MERVPLNARTLRDIPIFSGLPEYELDNIIRSPLNAKVTFEKGAKILEESAPGDCMYVILSGAVDVSMEAVDGHQVSIDTLKAGDYFGEQALLPGTSGLRNANIRALRACELFRITKEHVRQGLRESSGMGPSPEELARAPESQRIWQFLRGLRIFRGCDTGAFAAHADAFEGLSCYPGQIIYREAEPGEHLYVVMKGTVEIFSIDDEGKVTVLSRLARGGYFGEQALLPGSDGIRNVNARADDEVELVKIGRRFFIRVLQGDPKLLAAMQTVGQAEQKKVDRIHNKNEYT